MSGISNEDLELIGEVVGEALKGIDQRLAPLEEQLEALTQERQRLVLSVREFRQDSEGTISALGDELAGLRRELDAMRAENDILRQCLSPKDTMKAVDAISMLRSIR